MESMLIFLEICLVINIIGKPIFNHSDVDFLESYEDTNSANRDIFNNLLFNFSCKGRPPGLYADQEYDCRIFHICYENTEGIPVICASDTMFDQRERICDSQENVDCESAHEWFNVNVSKTTDNFEDEENDVPTVVPLMNMAI